MICVPLPAILQVFIEYRHWCCVRCWRGFHRGQNHGPCSPRAYNIVVAIKHTHDIVVQKRSGVWFGGRKLGADSKNWRHLCQVEVVWLETHTIYSTRLFQGVLQRGLDAWYVLSPFTLMPVLCYSFCFLPILERKTYRLLERAIMSRVPRPGWTLESLWNHLYL